MLKGEMVGEEEEEVKDGRGVHASPYTIKTPLEVATFQPQCRKSTLTSILHSLTTIY
jgi:hypothetical protein